MRSSRAWTARAAGLALRAAALYLVWLVIDDNVAQPELFTGVVVAILALALVIVVRRSSTVHPQIRISMLRRAWRVPVLVIADTVRVSATVVRTLTRPPRPHGRFRAVRYRGDEGQLAGRRPPGADGVVRPRSRRTATSSALTRKRTCSSSTSWPRSVGTSTR